MRSPRDARPVHYLLAALGALGISTAPILVTLSQATPTQAAFWRFAYALPLLAALVLARPSGRQAWRRRGWGPPAALGGLLFAADMVLWHHSIGLIGAGPSTLLANTQVIWLALFGLLLLGETPSRWFWGALPAIAVGLVLLSGGDLQGIPLEADRLGLAFGLGAGLCYAGALFCMRRSQRAATIPPEVTLVGVLCVALPAVGATGWIEGTLPATLSSSQHFWLVLLGVGAQVLSWMAITAGIRPLPGHHGGLVLLAQPVSSLLLGWWILDQSLSSARVLGAALVIGGVAATLLAETRGAR